MVISLTPITFVHKNVDLVAFMKLNVIMGTLKVEMDAVMNAKLKPILNATQSNQLYANFSNN